MEYDLPPFNKKEKHGFFEQTILDFSKDSFRNPVFGLSLGLLFNLIFIYSLFKSKNCLFIITCSFLVYLIFSIILFKLSKLERNK